jgi:hypothetical protein
MNYTNKFNFPDYVVQWLKLDEYDYEEGTFSATTLLQPPRIYALKKKHYDELEMDVSDLIASRYGTAIHDSIEKVGLTNCLQERRLRTLVDEKVITGKFDIMKKLENRKYQIVDVKSTSVWTYIFNSKEEDYIKQLSIYRFLGHMNGFNVIKDAEVFMIFTDWSPSKARKDPNYPQSRIQIVHLTLWDIEKTRKFITERVRLLDETSKLEESDMPECTEKELWAQKSLYDLKRNGRIVATYKKKPVKMLEDSSLELVERKGEVKRCSYCNVRNFCSQYKKLKEEGRIKE